MSTAREEDVIGNWLELALPITTHMIRVSVVIMFIALNINKMATR